MKSEELNYTNNLGKIYTKEEIMSFANIPDIEQLPIPLYEFYVYTDRLQFYRNYSSFTEFLNALADEYLINVGSRLARALND